MREKRYLIVNADDFGQSRGVNAGIMEAFQRGILTSTSLMVRWPAVSEALEYWRTDTSLSLGLHIDLGEWAYRDGEWIARYQVVDLEDPDEVSAEIERQVARFLEIVGAAPTHIDSHQHVHLKPIVREAAMAAAQRFGVPLRRCMLGVNYYGAYYEQGAEGAPMHANIELPGLMQTLRKLSPGVTELACHPGLFDDLDTTYLNERALEVRTLCDPHIENTLRDENIELCSFTQITQNEEVIK